MPRASEAIDRKNLLLLRVLYLIHHHRDGLTFQQLQERLAAWGYPATEDDLRFVLRAAQMRLDAQLIQGQGETRGMTYKITVDGLAYLGRHWWSRYDHPP